LKSCPWQEVTMQHQAQHPVREEVSQDALRRRRTAFKVRQQCNDGVLRCVPVSVSGIGLQLNIGI